MKEQAPVSGSAVADWPRGGDEKAVPVAHDIAYRRLAMVNVVLVGRPAAEDREWVLVDTGLPALTPMIERAAERRFGRSRPGAIILTHGHFDHSGGLPHLARKWNVSVYCHSLERPYLDGSAVYPPPDPTTGGGLMPMVSPLFPNSPKDLRSWLQPLPADGSLPFMPGWKWIPTPGHTPGHVSLWRESDRALISGDAVITTNQESAYAVAVQKPEIHGPPLFFTPNWHAARDSAQTLAALRPDLIVPGHGKAMRGPEMLDALELLAAEFESIAVPSASPYLETPARASDGTAYPAP